MAACYKAIPKHAFYKVYAEDVPIFLNLLTFFLPMATVDNAFTDYGSVSEILDTVEMYEQVGPSEDKILKVIYVRQVIKDLPVFRQYLKHNVDNFKGHARGSGFLRKGLGQSRSQKWLYAKYYCSGVSKIGFTASRYGFISSIGSRDS
ncbi:hypothetical protein N7485_001459 [Penicillium canescens]|nr:hypothetical protein N7485_001459 [Penicillium canescens]